METTNLNYKGYTIRAQLNDKPKMVLLCAIDVAKRLGYFNPNDAVANRVHAEDTFKRECADNLGRKQKMTFVNLFGALALIFGSRNKNEALEFKHWLIHEAMPIMEAPIIKEMAAKIVDKVRADAEFTQMENDILTKKLLKRRNRFGRRHQR